MVRRRKSTGRWNTTRQKRDTYNYQLKKGRKVVYRGITSIPKQRLSHQKNSGKKFTHMTISKYPVSRKTAKIRELKKLKHTKRI